MSDAPVHKSKAVPHYRLRRIGEDTVREEKYKTPEEAWAVVHEGNRAAWQVVKVFPAYFVAMVASTVWNEKE